MRQKPIMVYVVRCTGCGDKYYVREGKEKEDMMAHEDKCLAFATMKG